ncbi:uncharacterized protein LOC119680818 isoform X2 [Teleopsis dalmanni]|uniref:uncharacterized protein LOC119680818 isoform X2 n=1 Tax=Teleopsis dalmanni TaxID=139649 RepID=UPI0018CD0D50|nr:uncharacterized protein LOC119680818 isoform X2 [Teleopsis dalmanni]
MLVFIMILVVNACFAGTIPATPENITVTFLTPTTVRVSWQTMIDLNAHPVEKYIVTYKPTDDRVVQDVAGNSEAIILDRLSPSTQYSIAVTAIWLGKKYRSRQIIFRTLDMPKPALQQDFSAASNLGAGSNINFGPNYGGRTTNSSIFSDDVTSTATNNFAQGTHRELPTIRGVEIGIVLIVLMVWAGAIALFFNRWGKIRMLLPYQPDYKHEQLKVPGAGSCSGGVCNGNHSHQNLNMLQEEHSTSIAERCTRSRINSAIFVSSDGRGFDSIEFLRRHGSQSVLCRKAKSAENITDNDRKKSFSEKRQWRTNDGTDTNTDDETRDNMCIELQECRPMVDKSNRNDSEIRATTSLLGNIAPVTTSNMIVGSISIEAPPAYMKDDSNSALNTILDIQQEPLLIRTPPKTTSRDSTDTVEELILVPNETRSKVLVHQRSSTASSTARSQSPPFSSTHSSPKTLTLKGIKPKIGTLPMVSVSGPSPPHEKPPPSDCL